jgi:hypothetical protein
MGGLNGMVLGNQGEEEGKVWMISQLPEAVGDREGEDHELRLWILREIGRVVWNRSLWIDDRRMAIHEASIKCVNGSEQAEECMSSQRMIHEVEISERISVPVE